MQFLLANSLTYATYWNKQLNNFKKLFAKLAQLIRINNFIEYLLIRIIRVCNNENLTSNIRRTKFCNNLKESLLTGLNFVCNNPICNECP